jgi:hypothetical protein
MIKLRNGSAIVIEPKGAGLNIVLKSKDASKQEQVYTFTLPMSRVLFFYGSLFGKNYFATKNNQQYSLVVMHAGMKRKSQQNKTNETPATANDKDATTNKDATVSSTTQSDTSSEKKQNQIKDLELINLLVYEKQEGGKTPTKYVAKFTVSRVNILMLKQEVKKAMKQVDKWSLKMRSITITKAGSMIILTQNANQLILDYTNKDEIKDDLTEFIMSNREECTISKIKFTKDDAMTLLSLLTHMEI